MKIVSIEVAEAIKEAGYPQGVTEKVYLLKDYEKMKENWVIFREKCMHTDFIADMPTYFDVWLWLWREKNIRFDIEDLWDAELSYPERGCASNTNQLGGICTPEVSDPEEAIEAAIKYLVENNLIK